MIKKGDLVMVTRLMRCGHGKPGAIFTAGNVFHDVWWMCKVCGQMHPNCVVVEVGNANTANSAVEAWRLTKIDPPPVEQDILEETVA